VLLSCDPSADDDQPAGEKKGGVLTTWRAGGYGFLNTGSERDTFVHISAFEEAGLEPRCGKRYRFRLGTNKEGRSRAIDLREDNSTPEQPPTRPGFTYSAECGLARRHLLLRSMRMHATGLQPDGLRLERVGSAPGVGSARTMVF
jgi:cold shock CspA family protein